MPIFFERSHVSRLSDCVFILAGVLLFSFSARAEPAEGPLEMASAGDAKQDTETELRIGLKPSGYERIRKGWQFASSSSRRDVYLDFFEGEHFQMRLGSSPIKARFMNTQKGTKWQVAQQIQLQAFKSEKITATAKESRRIRFDGSRLQGLQELSSRAEKFYEGLGKASLTQTDLEQFSEMLLSNGFIQGSLESLGQTPSGRVLLTAAVSQKDRLAGQFRTDEAVLDVVLGATKSKDRQGFGVLEYEFEADCDGNLSSGCQAAFAKLLAELELMGISQTDVETQSNDGFAYAESIYSRASGR